MKLRFLFIFFFAVTALQAMSKLESDTIGVRTFFYEDETRNRPVTVELWYPTEQNNPLAQAADPIWIHPKEVRDAPLSKARRKYPLILMSHGHGGGRRNQSWLAERLVRQGYIVASIQHHGNCQDCFDPVTSMCFWERPKDVTFALDQLQQESLLKSRLQNEKVGFVGYSMGGMTGLALAGAKAQHVKEVALALQSQMKELPLELIEKADFSEAYQDYHDARIKAFLLICPATFIYPAATLKEIKKPIGLIATAHDEVLPHQEHAEKLIQSINPEKVLLVQKLVPHNGFTNQLSMLGKEFYKKTYKKDLPSFDQPALQEEVGSFAQEFFNQKLSR